MRPKALSCACAYTDLDAHTGECEFFNELIPCNIKKAPKRRRLKRIASL